MKKIYISTLLALVSQLAVYAQDVNDAILYGYQNYYGTARSMAIGNAAGSIGADMGGVVINPSNIGLFRSSQLNFTLANNKSNTTGNYYANSNQETKNKLNLSEIGIVLTSKGRRERQWKNVQFGFVGNRIADFNYNYSYTGTNYKSSLIERFADDFNRAGGYNDYALNNVNDAAYAAWSTYLIDRDFAGDTTQAKAYVPYTDGISQTKVVRQSGGIMNYSISLAGNYKEKFLLGASLGIDNIIYNNYFLWSEKDISGKKNNDFNYVDFSETNATSGTGINLKIGATYLASKNFRMGLALHTPTSYQMRSEYLVTMETDTDSLLFASGKPSKTTYQQDSTLVSEYTFRNPAKAILSGTYLLDKFGFISADIEYVDYSTLKYRFANNFNAEEKLVNNALANTYQSVMNIRLGAEIKLGYTYLRCGYALYGNPYKNISSPTNKYSLGLGYRGKDAYIDLAYVHTTRSITETPYTLQRTNADIQQATINNNANVVALTLGVKF